MDLREVRLEVVDWMHLGQARDQWQDLVNTVMNLRCSIKCGEFLTSQEEICSMVLVRW
jgi:hypothetical protein